MTDQSDRIVKYGLPASESEKLVERHFEVTLLGRAVADAVFAHALRQGPKLRQALNRLKDSDRP